MAPTKPMKSPKQTTSGRSANMKKSASKSSTTGNASAPSKRTTDASARIQSDVLLAIQPTHLQNIVTKKKNHEYRKYRLKDGVERLWLYETRGTRDDPGRAAITHIATIPSTVRHTPGSVPETPHGIGNADFNTGLKESKCGYPILELYELVKAVSLEEMKTVWGLSAPMGWMYLPPDLWEDRWGQKEGREERVTQLF